MKRHVFLCCCILLLAVAKGGTRPPDPIESAIASTREGGAREDPAGRDAIAAFAGSAIEVQSSFEKLRQGAFAPIGDPAIEARSEEGAPTEQVPERWRLLMQKLQQPMPSSPEEVSASSATALLQGDYIFSSTGASYDLILGTDVQSAIGGFTFDGRGGFTGFQTSRTLFTSRTFFRFGGTYTVDSSGVGSLFYFYPTAQTHTIIVVNGGDAFFFVDVNSSNFREAGYARRIN